MTTISGNNTGSIQLTTIADSDTQSNFTLGGGGSGGMTYAFTRARTVTFIAQGLKPNTSYFPFFNDIFVGYFCSSDDSPEIEDDPESPDYGKIKSTHINLVSDAIGNIVGNFYIPSNTFASGSNIFKLVDHIGVRGGKVIADPWYGSAEAIYESGNILKNQQNQLTGAAGGSGAGSATLLTTPVSLAAGTVDAVPSVTCESWFFEYRVTSTSGNTFKITTDSPTPPSGNYQSGGVVIPDGASDDVIYVSTAANGDGTYDHLFSYTQEDRTATFRQEAITEAGVDDAATIASLPSLVGFRPSGIDVDATVSVLLYEGQKWRKKGAVACPVNYGFKTPTRTDPLAQSFFVDAQAYPDGFFVTSIGIYFKTVDHSVPVVLEIRDLTNGLPGSNVLPCASAVVPGYAASASNNSTVSTIFRFDQPVYLQPSTDYCFVLKSSSLGYNAWTSIVGKIDVHTGKVIDAQPFTGTLFKSENDVTWVPAPLEDLKFDMYKADFDTSQKGIVVFHPKEFTIEVDDGSYQDRPIPADADFVTSYYSTAQILPLSFISTTKGSKTVGVEIPQHGLLDDDYIYIRSVPVPDKIDAYNGIREDQLNGLHPVAIVSSDMVTINTAGVGSNLAATKSGRLSFSDLTGILNNAPGNMPLATVLTDAVEYIDPSVNIPSSNPATRLTARVAPDGTYIQPHPPVLVSPNSFLVFTNIVVNEAMVDYVGTELEHTSIVEKVTLAGINLDDDTYTTPTVWSEAAQSRTSKFWSYDSPRLIATPRNEQKHANEMYVSEPHADSDFGFPSSCKVVLELDSSSKDISPVIDTSGMTLTVKSYKIDNQGLDFQIVEDEYVNMDPSSIDDFLDATKNSELASGSGVALAKYKSQIVLLDKPYNKISLFVTGNCYSEGGEATFDVYIRTTTDVLTHGDHGWTYVPCLVDALELTTPPRSRSRDALDEWHYEYSDLTKFFSVFDVKIVMRSTNSSYVPKIFGLRGIANILLPSIE